MKELEGLHAKRRFFLILIIMLKDPLCFPLVTKAETLVERHQLPPLKDLIDPFTKLKSFFDGH